MVLTFSLAEMISPAAARQCRRARRASWMAPARRLVDNAVTGVQADSMRAWPGGRRTRDSSDGNPKGPHLPDMRRQVPSDTQSRIVGRSFESLSSPPACPVGAG